MIHIYKIQYRVPSNLFINSIVKHTVVVTPGSKEQAIAVVMREKNVPREAIMNCDLFGNAIDVIVDI